MHKDFPISLNSDSYISITILYEIIEIIISANAVSYTVQCFRIIQNSISYFWTIL